MSLSDNMSLLKLYEYRAHSSPWGARSRSRP
jgi:hypothetical protein